MKPPCDRQYMPAGPGHYMNRSQGTITLSPGGVPGSSLGGPPAFAHCSLPLAARARPAADCFRPSVASLRRRPHSRSVAASASLAPALLSHADDRQLHSASRPLSSFALAVCQVDRSLCIHSVQSLGRQAIITITASPLGEEEPGPEGAERGGYLPIPRRDARAGEWG